MAANTMAGGTARSQLAPVEIHDVLSNERRQKVLELLRENGHAGSMTARELSERIAEHETGESPPPRNIRQSAYVSLHQTHLPKLDELGIVRYDQSGKTVELTDRAQEVSVYMETVPKYGLSWSEYYVGVSVVGLLLLVATSVGVPFFDAVSGTVWASLVLLVLLGSAVYQTLQQQSSFLHRLRGE